MKTFYPQKDGSVYICPSCGSDAVPPEGVVCRDCYLRAVKEELDRLKRVMALHTSCDPDVGWGGD